MHSFRSGFVSEGEETESDSKNDIGEFAILDILDYSKGLDGLPKSDEIKYLLDGGSSVIVRPSGTEPKLKTYISVTASALHVAEKADFSQCH